MPHYHSLSLLRRTFALWILNFETRRISGRVDISDSDQECGVHLRAVSIAIQSGFRLQPQPHSPHSWDQRNMLGWTHPRWIRFARREQENGGMHCALEAILKNGIDVCVFFEATVDETWLVGGFKHLLVSIIYGMSSFPLTFIFFKMVKTTNQNMMKHLEKITTKRSKRSKVHFGTICQDEVQSMSPFSPKWKHT